MREWNYIFKRRSQMWRLNVSVWRCRPSYDCTAHMQHTAGWKHPQDTVHTSWSSGRKKKWGEESEDPSETVTETCHEIHKRLNCEWPQVKQNTKMADASRRDRKRKMPDRLTRTKSATTEGWTDTQAGDTGWDWQMPGGSDLQRSIWVTVWWVTC